MCSLKVAIATALLVEERNTRAKGGGAASRIGGVHGGRLLGVTVEHYLWLQAAVRDI